MIIMSSNPRILRRVFSTKVALSTLNWFWFAFNDGDHHCACQLSGTLIDSCCLPRWERESLCTGGSDLTLHYHSGWGRTNACAMIPVEKNPSRNYATAIDNCWVERDILFWLKRNRAKTRHKVISYILINYIDNRRFYQSPSFLLRPVLWITWESICKARCEMNFVNVWILRSPGVDVVIIIFCEKIGVFLKYQCYDQLFFKI
jgi:hypothetical protein